jgi:hypothetical protein
VLRIDDLVQFVDRNAILRMSDGEVATIHVIFVDRDARDIIGDILQPSRPERYLKRSSAYAFTAGDIETADIQR